MLVRSLHHSLVSLLLAVTVFTVGCGARPDSSAKEWMQAFVAKDGVALSALTCDASQGALTATTAFAVGLGWLNTTIIGGAIKISLEDLEYHTASSSGDNATVKVTGKVRASVLGIAYAESLDIALPMRWERGKWRACNV